MGARSTVDYGRQARATRNHLAQFVEEVRGEEGRDVIELSPEIGRFIADRFERFLSGSTASLDEAFGQKRIRGRPKPTPDRRKVEQTIAAFPLIMQGLTWEEIGGRVDELNPIDGSDMRRIVERHKDAAWEELGRRVSRAMASND